MTFLITRFNEIMHVFILALFFFIEREKIQEITKISLNKAKPFSHD